MSDMRLEVDKSRSGWWLEFEAWGLSYETGSDWFLQAVWWMVRGIWRQHRARALVRAERKRKEGK